MMALIWFSISLVLGLFGSLSSPRRGDTDISESHDSYLYCIRFVLLDFVREFITSEVELSGITTIGEARRNLSPDEI